MREDHSKNVQAVIMPSQFSTYGPLRSGLFSSLLNNSDVEISLRQVGNTTLDAIE